MSELSVYIVCGLVAVVGLWTMFSDPDRTDVFLYQIIPSVKKLFRGNQND